MINLLKLFKMLKLAFILKAFPSMFFKNNVINILMFASIVLFAWPMIFGTFNKNNANNPANLAALTKKIEIRIKNIENKINSMEKNMLTLHTDEQVFKN